MQKSWKDKNNIVANITSTKGEAHIAEIGSDKETLMACNAENPTLYNNPFFENISDPNVYTNVATNESTHMYDWLADSRSTNHITNRWELYSSYEPMLGATVHEVGGKISQVAGWGTILLTAQYGTCKRTLRLENINYIPSNKYNIFALGRWDSQGRRYEASKGELILFNRLDVPVLKGLKIASNIYKFKLTPINTNKISYTFLSQENKQTWEIWHWRFGHVSYKGLKRLHNNKLLDGFMVDVNTPMPDCTSCIEAKQSVKPYAKQSETVHTNKGEITYMDLWGKYDVMSINGHQYYLVLVDNATWYMTIYFLKGKHEAVQQIKNFMTYLHACRINTYAIRIDWGIEFINKDLQEWYHAKGMEIQITAPYSPSQNSVAEQMNHMLVELACMMINTAKLPEFLWEPTVAYAAYVWNCAYTIVI